MTEEDWQPIETAPKDGAVVLCHHAPIKYVGILGKDGLSVTPCKWLKVDCEGFGWYSVVSDEVTEHGEVYLDSIRVEPTAWMPMPAPPKKVIHSPG